MSPDGVQRTAVVAGGSRGIGRACVRRLADDDVEVVSLSRAGGHVDGAVLSLACDVTSGDQVEGAIRVVRDEVGPIDILIVSAGSGRPSPALLMTEHHFAEEIDLNLAAAFRLVRIAARDMWRRHWGRVVFLGSVAAELGCPGASAYAASKAGLEGLARSLATELAERGITVNVVAPGAIETEFTRAYSGWRDVAPAAIPLHRLGGPDEVAALVSFLASDDAAYITGSVIPIDGGLRLRAL